MTEHAAALAHWEALLAGEGFPTRLVPAGPDAPQDTLLAGVTGDDGTLLYQVELSFIPGMEEQLEGASLLQCFARVPGDAAPAAEPELARLLLRLNGRIPLVGFGFLEAERMLCFRHVLVLPADPAAADALVVQTAWLVSYLLTLFGASAAAVAAGALSADDAIRQSPFRSAFA